MSAVVGLAPGRTRAVLRELFPSGVRSAAAEIQPEVDGLHAQEQALVARAVPKRRREFATGRVLARELLDSLGWPDFTLLADADRAPLWPESVVGSISHGHALCVAVAAARGAIAGLGVDVEAADAVSPALYARVLRPAEEAWLHTQPAARQRHLAAVFFSAKETVYKAQFPLTRARLGFFDVEVELDPARSRFAARVPGFPRTLTGAFALELPWVISGLALLAEDATA